MRRFLLFFGILFVSSFIAFAQNPDDDFEAFIQTQHKNAETDNNVALVKYLMDTDLLGNIGRIKELSAKLTPEQKEELHENFDDFIEEQEQLALQGGTSNKANLTMIRYLIEKDFEGNQEQIAELAANLTQEEKEELYQDYETSAGKYFALNLILGFGIGSFAQGDKESGRRQLLFTCAGIALICAGMNNPNLATFFCCMGGGFCLGATISGCVAPWVFAANQNEALCETLGLPIDSIAFAPVIDPDGKSFGLVAKINF